MLVLHALPWLLHVIVDHNKYTLSPSIIICSDSHNEGMLANSCRLYESNETAGNSQAEYAAISYGDKATLSNKEHRSSAAADHNDPEYAAVQGYEQPCILTAPNQSYRALTGHHEPPTLHSAGYENVSSYTFSRN